MKYSARQYAVALHQAIFESHPKEQEKILDRFAALLKANGDLRLFDEIEQEFLGYNRKVSNVQTAEVSSAKELNAEEEQELIRELNDYVGGRVELKKRVDEGLVGGIVVKIGDELLDGSVKRTLKDLKHQLIDHDDRG